MTSKAARWGCYFGVVGILMVLIAVFGYRMELLGLRNAIMMFLFAGSVAMFAVILSLIGLWKARPGSELTGLPMALIGLILGGMLSGVVTHHTITARMVPRIHDISTDTNNPPQFVALLSVRQAAPNGADYAGDVIAKLQHRAYPDIKSLKVGATPDQTFERALNVVKSLGWKIASADKGQHRIEATDTTYWFEYKDDVVIRITASPDGSVVDVRSMSRVGKSDLGMNAKRIRLFFERLKEA